ncbi:MAG: winged helix-turn-helix domain-containing protein [Anaerolineae bacterium]
MSVLLQILEKEGPFVTFVHGIGGIGKSSLLETFVTEGRERGVTFVRLDCRTIEPSEQGFLRELEAAVGGQVNTVETAATRLESLGKRVVLALDTYEVFRMMDTWLRRTFIPSLSDNVRVLLFGREPPVAAWRVSPGWQGLFQSIRLGPLPERDALKLLQNAGLEAEAAKQVNGFAHGHPLSLKLALVAIAERPDLRFREIASQHVLAELTRLYLADVPDPQTRAALEAASTLRRTTRSLLGAMLPDSAPQDTYERLAGLPFAETGSDGLIIHDAVRQVIASTLKAADPNRYRLYRRAAWRQLRKEVRTADKQTLWRYTADMLYMIEEPIIREAFFPSDMQPYAVDPAHPEDAEAILEIIAKTEGTIATEHLTNWWSVAPKTFRVIRDRDGIVAGFYIVFEPASEYVTLMQKDPLLKNWWQHLQKNPTPERQKVLFCRRWLAEEQGELPSPVQAACWLDLKGLYMDMRSTLRRIYCTAINADVYGPVLVKLGFQLLPQAAVELDGHIYHTAMLDFGPGLVNGWMAGHVRAELGVKEEELLDYDARELILAGQRVALTPLEFGVMAYLYDREGKVVTRNELLDSVWGYEYYGGSNVVDARIRALRKKLGDYAAMIETVTGVGYRFRRG